MEISNWENHETEVSFALQAIPSELLTFQSLFLDILNEVHFRQAMSNQGERIYTFFIKKHHIPKLKASIANVTTVENEVAITMRQVIHHADALVLCPLVERSSMNSQ